MMLQHHHQNCDRENSSDDLKRWKARAGVGILTSSHIEVV